MQNDVSNFLGAAARTWIEQDRMANIEQFEAVILDGCNLISGTSRATFVGALDPASGRKSDSYGCVMKLTPCLLVTSEISALRIEKALKTAFGYKFCVFLHHRLLPKFGKVQHLDFPKFVRILVQFGSK